MDYLGGVIGAGGTNLLGLCHPDRSSCYGMGRAIRIARRAWRRLGDRALRLVDQAPWIGPRRDISGIGPHRNCPPWPANHGHPAVRTGTDRHRSGGLRDDPVAIRTGKAGHLRRPAFGFRSQRREFLFMQPGRLLGRTLGLAPFFQHLPFHGIQPRHQISLARVGAGEFDAVAAGIKEVD
jgi:hypothetical protein